jgi:hypothetical protein
VLKVFARVELAQCDLVKSCIPPGHYQTKWMIKNGRGQRFLSIDTLLNNVW